MKLAKEIKSKKGEVHFKRWKLFSLFGMHFYLHGIYKADEDEHLHNHPWNIWTIILRGGYIERTESGTRPRRVGHIAYATKNIFHKIDQMYRSPTYTLAIVGKRKNPNWGYMVNGKFVDHIAYRNDKNKKNDV